MAKFEDVIDAVDALAATHLGDVQQTVTTREDVDERTELGDVHDTTVVLLLEFSLRRIDDVEDGRLRLLHAPRLDCTDGDDAAGTVVVDGNVSSGLLLDRVDDLALRADDFTDLVHRDVDRADLRCRLGDFIAGSREALVHHFEDLEASNASLSQRSRQHVGRNAVDLRVELQGCDGVFGTSDLEVHVAHGVFGTEDVGERHVLAIFVDETHSDTRHVTTHRHASVHQREAGGANRTHRGRAIRGHDLRDEAQCVRKVFLVRDGRKDRSCCEGTVADLAALRRTNATGFAVCPWRHVVVVQVTLRVVRRQRVDHLVHTRHRHRQNGHDLSFATLEEGRTVSASEHAGFGADLAQVTRRTTVDANTFVEDAATHHLLHEAANSFLDHLVLAGELAAVTTELRNAVISNSVDGLVAIALIGNRDGRGHGLGTDLFDSVKDFGGVVEDRGPRHWLNCAVCGDDRGNELALQCDRLFDPHLAGLEGVAEYFFGDLLGAIVVVVERVLGATGFDHHHGDVAVFQLTTGNHDLEGSRFGLFEGRMRDPLAFLAVGQAYGAERSVKRDPRDHQSSGGCVDREYIVRVRLVGAEHGRDDLRLVAETLRERRAQRPVGESAREDRVLGRATFTTEERAGDLAGGVGTLFDVNRQREEVHAFAD